MREEYELQEPRRGYGIGRAVGTLAIGATVGSLIALLFAPASGRVTRRRIAMKVRTLGRQTARKLNRTGRLIARRADEFREVTADKLHDAREWVVEHVTNGNTRRVRHRATRHA